MTSDKPKWMARIDCVDGVFSAHCSGFVNDALAANVEAFCSVAIAAAQGIVGVQIARVDEALERELEEANRKLLKERLKVDKARERFGRLASAREDLQVDSVAAEARHALQELDA